MTGVSKFQRFLVSLFFIGAMVLFISGPDAVLAQDVVVSAAVPDSAPQGSVNLLVTVKGNGFKKGAVAQWLVHDSETDTGGVTVNSTTYVSPSELRANITVAPNAQTDKKFDIKVMVSGGRTGKGIELFKVIDNPPDPAIAFIASSPTGDLMVVNANGTYLKRIFADTVLHNVGPSWSPDGSQLALMQSAGINQYWLSVMDKDGSNRYDVIPTGNYMYVRTAWSPYPLDDGEYKILYRDEEGSGLQRQSDQYLVNLDGTGLVNLTRTSNYSEMYATWSPTLPARIAARRGPNVIVYDVVYANGSFSAVETHNLTSNGPLKDIATERPAWAKTQDKIAVEALDDIWVIDFTNPDSPVTVRLTNTLGYKEQYPTWSPDDSQIAFSRVPLTRNSKEKSGIFVMNADGADVRPLVYPSDGTMLDWRRCCPTCDTVCGP